MAAQPTRPATALRREMGTSAPQYGQVYLATLSPIRGSEQAGTRPILIVSPTSFNRGSLVLAVPLTRTNRHTPLHVQLEPPEGGLRSTSFAMPEQVRSISRSRLLKLWGTIHPSTSAVVAARLHQLMPIPANAV